VFWFFVVVVGVFHLERVVVVGVFHLERVVVVGAFIGECLFYASILNNLWLLVASD